MPLILRAVKGSKLTIVEMDGNLTYLASTLSGSVIQVTGSSMSAPNTSITASSFSGNGSQLTFITASFVTASNVFGPNGANSILSSSYALSASRAVSSSFALTASYVNPLRQDVQITGSLFVSNSINSNNRILNSTTGNESINWESGYTKDSNGIFGVDWENRILYDSTQNDSIDWENRALKDISANNVVEWSTGLFQPSLDDSINLGESSNRWRNTYISRNLYIGTNNTESILTGGGLKLPTQSATPNTTPAHGNGTIAVGKNAGSYFIYVYLDNQWRSASLS